jgi:hypothetical protein
MPGAWFGPHRDEHVLDDLLDHRLVAATAQEPRPQPRCVPVIELTQGITIPVGDRL